MTPTEIYEDMNDRCCEVFILTRHPHVAEAGLSARVGVMADVAGGVMAFEIELHVDGHATCSVRLVGPDGVDQPVTVSTFGGDDLGGLTGTDVLISS